ncbi:hypothetical protein B0H34DRAFT_797606 [Crassisporium funariophilum]|nr:hypothetical protein B0H34DRAFT_797606 [Crassisporium funariophilum]
MSSTDPIPQTPTIGSSSDIERRPQADPLPSKRGEIGYDESLHVPTPSSQEPTSDPTVRPARHPADRDLPPVATDAVTPTLTVQPEITAPASPSSDQSSTTSITKPAGILGFLKPKSVVFGGLQASTLLALALQIVLFGATIVAWVFASKLLLHVANSNQRLPGGPSSTVFVHVVFVFATIGQLIFMERRIFRLRGERYSYLHPGEVLPRYRSVPSPSSTTIAFAPWNRPPLPTYAAALASSGVGTGDVEDHLIAAPPPPAYGNTRGSTLLLAGFLRDSLRVQRPPSAYLQASPGNERPLSYVSRDETWEEIQDAERARRLEETLSRLESPSREMGTTRS